MIKILTKFGAKITIIVVKNREPYYFITIYKCKEVLLSLFSYQMLASTFDSDEWSSNYKVYVYKQKAWISRKMSIKFGNTESHDHGLSGQNKWY